jgi:transcriptional regulator with XRE-family HTH domain
MVKTQPESPAGRRLVAELLRLRIARGWESEHVAAKLGWSPSKISRIENSRSGIYLHDLQKLLTLFGVSPDQRTALLQLAEAAVSRKRAPGQGRAPGEPTAEEVAASTVVEWSPLAVPRLLRTWEYSTELLQQEQVILKTPPSDVARVAEAIAAWQSRLTDAKPTACWAVLDESVLHRRFTGPAVMRAQLEHLAEMAELPNVKVRVLRVGVECRPAADAFTYLKFDPVGGFDFPDVVLGEHLAGGRWRKDADQEVWQHGLVLDHLLAASASAEESTALIRQRF